MPLSDGEPAATDAVTGPLTDRPGWLYLLREFETLYRLGSAGGSSKIRSHRRKVRDALSRAIAADPAR
ncbi:MAG: hypothetical protein AAF264_08150 [Pseudomonadota bacterium]